MSSSRPFGGFRYVPLRRIPRYAPGKTLPRLVAEWATLYHAGQTFRRIALDTGWLPGRKRQALGSFSPAAIRNAFVDWGIERRKPGGRGSMGRALLVRIAELERRVDDLEREHSRRTLY